METLERKSFEHLFKQDHYRPDELAELLEVDPYLIRHEVFIGDLKARVLDHHVIDIRREDVLRWLTDRDN
jgi:hypothetical protein